MTRKVKARWFLTMAIAVVSTALFVALAAPAHAVNLTRNGINGLSRTYGFLLAVDHTLARIEREFPDLRAPAIRARVLFDSTYPDSKGKIRASMVKVFGQKDADQVHADLLAKLIPTLERLPMDHDGAVRYLAQFDRWRRAEGLEAPIGEYLLALKYEHNPLAEIADGYKTTFRTDGSGKSLGLRIAINLPRSFAMRDSERPHILKVWTSEGGNGTELVMLLVNDTGEPQPTVEQIRDELRSGELQKGMAEGYTVVKSSPMTLEGLPGYWADIDAVQERAGNQIYQRMRQYMVFFRSRAISVQCTNGGDAAERARTIQDAERYLPLCQAVVNSLVLPQRYER